MAREDGRESPDVLAGYARPNASNRAVVGSREELDPTSGLLPPNKRV
jgi:hypothetical protein